MFLGKRKDRQALSGSAGEPAGPVEAVEKIPADLDLAHEQADGLLLIDGGGTQAAAGGVNGERLPQLVSQSEIIDDETAGFVFEDAVDAGDGLHEPVTFHGLVDVHGMQAGGVKAGEPHIADDNDLEGIGGELRPGIVHRLDKDTSGIILMAKNEHALRWLQDQFRLRKVRKIYLALVDGKPPTPSGRVEAAIARDPAHRKQMAIVPDGKGREAITEYITLRQFPQHTLIEAHPLTGRTHQIRLHMAFLHCPIVGDIVYGRKKPSLPLERHFLHAAQLSVVLPGDDQPTLFQAPLPQELQQVLNDLISVYGEGNENH